MNETFKLRTVIVFLFFCILLSIALAHLFYLQIRQHDYFVQMASKQYSMTIVQHPPRASIIDRNGILLATNKLCQSAFVTPNTLHNKKALQLFLHMHFPEAYDRLIKKSSSPFMFIKRRLTEQELTLINNAQLDDIYLLDEPNRFYPHTSCACIVGITDIDNKGIFGIEHDYDERLAGSPSTYILEKDARSGRYYFSKNITEEGTEGLPVSLSIDSHLQFLAQEELEAQMNHFNSKEGAIVIMDPETGDVYTMASAPTFDPHETTHLDQTLTHNRSITDCYEFGSAFKAFSALAALAEGVVTPDEEIDCENKKTTIFEGRTINTVYPDGIITFSRVIEISNNIGIAKVTKRLGPRLYDHYVRLGFGTKTGLGLAGEQSGFVNPPENWSKQSCISLSYGYEVTTTLMRLATSFCVFCNGGYLIQPRIILNPKKDLLSPKKIYDETVINNMRIILEKTVSQEGSGKYAAIKGYRILGKTSTANLLVDGHYDPNKNFFGFIGAVEKGSYKRVIGCFLKESSKKGIYAATTAAPLFKKIVEKMLIHDKIILGDQDESSLSCNSTT